VTAEARQAEAQAKSQIAQQELELKQRELEANLQAAQEEAIGRREQAFADIQASQDRKDVELAKLAVAQDKTVKELASAADINQINNETARQKMFTDLAKFREELKVKRDTGTGI